MMLAKFALGGLALYVGLVAVLALGQGALVFPRGAVGAAPSLPAHTQWLQLGRGDVTLQGVRIAGRQPDLPVLLGFGGNAWNAESMALYLHQIAPDHDVVAYHYRGYAPSTGTPSSAALMADAEAIFDATSALQGVIAVGFSIGAAGLLRIWGLCGRCVRWLWSLHLTICVPWPKGRCRLSLCAGCFATRLTRCLPCAPAQCPRP
jgi:uncharacterized protein